MTNPAQVTVDAASAVLRVPLELFAALGRPRRIAVRTELPDRFFLTAGGSARATWRRFKDAAIATVARRQRRLFAAEQIAVEPDAALYACDRRCPFASPAYHVANYHPLYYLMAAEPVAEHAGRQHAWQTFADYHEHRRIAVQDAGAHAVSRWLAADVVGPMAPASVLELGCGAGRNLRHIADRLPAAVLHGVDINAGAIAVAREELREAALHVGSLYELGHFADASIDVVFTSGVLMHVPHDRVQGVVREMHRIARRAVLHFELHGPSHGFDFHRYPRDYAALYRTMGLRHESYVIFPSGDVRSSGTASFNHALLVAPARGRSG